MFVKSQISAGTNNNFDSLQNSSVIQILIMIIQYQYFLMNCLLIVSFNNISPILCP